jgi:Glycosyl hydrolase family 20, domain 2
MQWFPSSSCLWQVRSGARIGMLLGAALMAAGQTRADLTVGQMTTWPIVILADPTSGERYAAAEFRNLVAQATGTRMEIIAASGPRDSGIFIGKASRRKAEDLGEEAFRIVIDDHRVEIAGGSPRGTLYGVYTFLEDELGVRFLTPDHTYVPHAGPGQALKTGERIISPRFAWRYSYYGMNMAHPEFATRLRNNAVRRCSTISILH